MGSTLSGPIPLADRNWFTASISWEADWRLGAASLLEVPRRSVAARRPSAAVRMRRPAVVNRASLTKVVILIAAIRVWKYPEDAVEVILTCQAHAIGFS